MIEDWLESQYNHMVHATGSIGATGEKSPRTLEIKQQISGKKASLNTRRLFPPLIDGRLLKCVSPSRTKLDSPTLPQSPQRVSFQ